MTMQQPGSTDPNTIGGNGTTTAANAPASPAATAPPVPPPAPAPASAVAGGEDAPAWLPARLQREREAAQRALLAEIGVPDLATARSRMAEAANAASATARTASLEETIRQRVAVELASLTPEQRTAVTAIAGNDQARVLTTIDQLRPTWGSSPVSTTTAAQTSAAVATTTTTPAAPAAPAPAAAPPPAPDTAPGRTAPGGAPPPAAPTHTSQYNALLKENPFAAADYFQQFGKLIAAGK